MSLMGRSQQGTIYNQCNMTTGPVSSQYMRKSTGFYITTTFFLNSSTHCSQDQKCYYSVLLLVSYILQNLPPHSGTVIAKALEKV